ncbi:MAG: TIGR00282 family metallophosphoesterase [Spirochaetes bacterium]|nr:MAG: TIGR00282 family metallophosphoesterase [Spirochaetota bacterium]
MDDKLVVLVIGDVVGKPGRKIISRKLVDLRNEYGADLVIANGENGAGGNAITPGVCHELFNCGVDVITTGNHIWDNRDILQVIDTEPRLLRPANFPPGVPGHGVFTGIANGWPVCVVNLQGRVNLPPLDDPFRAFDAIHARYSKDYRIMLVDLHAEATSEKRAFGWYVDGRASAVYGTHTHVQTSDEEVLPRGTAYITDIGMTGSFNSVIGMDKQKSIERFITQARVKYEIAEGNVKLNGAVITIRPDGKAERITRLIVTE